MNEPPTALRRINPQLAVTCGFAIAGLLWVTWFVTHLPWLNLSERTAEIVVGVVWLVSAAATGRAAGRGSAVATGALAGAITAALGLMVLGSKLRPASETAGPVAESVGSSAGVVIAAFLGAGVVIGAVGGLLGGRRALTPRDRADHLPDFAFVSLGIILSLVFVGGLVTSTKAGMAVPDWPSTFGSNMLLYPLGPTVPISVFLEHAHRLFGMLLGATTLTLTVWTLFSSRPGFIKAWAAAVFVLVCLQGLLGGERVIQNKQVLALIHGISAQLIAAGLAMLAAYLSPAYAAALDAPRPEKVRRARALATGAFHSLLLQIALGAAYRHFPNAHGLWTHAIFALVVAIMVALAGFAAGSLRGESQADRPHLRSTRRAGTAAATLVGVQFLLGWFAFFMAGDAQASTAPLRVLVRTAHQANGAVLAAAVAWTFVMVRQINRSTHAPQT